jgi:hypothetical protein
MERRVDGPAAEMRCPQCGLIIKVTNQPPDKCPVCGTKLPVIPVGKKGAPERKGPISLEQALFPRARESWAPRDMFNAFMLTFFVVFAVNYLILAGGGAIDVNGQLTFDPVLYFTINLAGVLVGFTPVVYILMNKTTVKKLGLKEISKQQWMRTAVFGIVCGIGLYAMQLLGSAINLATGLDSLVQSQAEIAYTDFIAEAGNRLFILIPLAIAQVVGEFFYRGTVLNGLVQWLQKRVPPIAAAALKLRAWSLSVLLGTLFDFSLFFNPTSIVPSLLAHALVGVLYIATGNVQSCMIAQTTCMMLLILFV